MRSLTIAALTSALLTWASPGVAQQSVDYASISGRITDASDGVLPGARITARHTGTNLIGNAIADRDGRFRFPYLQIGSYEITVCQEGFQDAIRQLTLTAGAAFEITVTLDVGGVDAAVTVTGETMVLEAARSQIAGTVSEPEVRTLPMSGRNFLELALLIPGVAPANVASTQLFPETSAVPGVSLSVGSQRNLSNNFIVDGLSANDDAAALSGATFGVDAVEQVQVVTSGGQAELGRALGGYVSVVTRSGTNVLQGTAYSYLRDDRLNGRNALSGTKLPMNQAQYGSSLGGPIVANRTFYFANMEQRRIDQTGLATISDANVRAINARLLAVGYQGPTVATGLYPNPVDSTNVLAKLNHQFSGTDHFSVRYGLYGVSADNVRGAGGLSAPSASANLDSRDHTLAIGNTFAISARTVLETRAQFAHSELEAPPSDVIGPAVTIAGVASFGRNSGSPTRRVNRLYQIVNNLSHQAGAHAFRVGIDFLHNEGLIAYPRSVRGSYTFSSLPKFLAGVYNNAGFTQTFGASEVTHANPNVGMYVQDEWKVGSRVTLNLGARYDLQFLETITTDADNVSPRVGVAWLPFGSRRTLVRAGAGFYYDRVPLRALANALLSADNTTDVANLRQVSVSLSPAQAGAPLFPNVLPGTVSSVTLANLTTMDRDLQNAYSRQASVQVEQQMGERVTISVGYQYLRGLNLLMSVNQNVPACVASGTNNGCRPNPAYANNSQYSSVGESNYHGLHVSFTQRPSAWGHYRVSYTLSKSMNNLGEYFFSAPLDPLDLSKDWGRSDDDQRHRLVISGAVQISAVRASSAWECLTRGFQVSGTLRAYSATPFNITSGITTVQGTPGRPIVNGRFIERNAGEGSAFLSLDLRVSRSFRLGRGTGFDAFVEAFNVTNHRNVVTRNTNFGAGAYPANPSPAFGQITAVADARSFQLGARVRF